MKKNTLDLLYAADLLFAVIYIAFGIGFVAMSQTQFSIVTELLFLLVGTIAFVGIRFAIKKIAKVALLKVLDNPNEQIGNKFLSARSYAFLVKKNWDSLDKDIRKKLRLINKWTGLVSTESIFDWV